MGIQEDMNDEPIEVTTMFLKDGSDGEGWYCFESEYPEEGYFWVSDSEPTEEDIKKIHPSYTFNAQN